VVVLVVEVASHQLAAHDLLHLHVDACEVLAVDHLPLQGGRRRLVDAHPRLHDLLKVEDLSRDLRLLVPQVGVVQRKAPRGVGEAPRR